ncbi:cytochrome c oxidase subunit II [Plastorhodobacter daqingensis]|uniref:Cytochrome aa3 subunit 2 n=1 Tax=Plastorhodobacter daqingensis TaxID=1387281 RepID=A0ABW2UQ04_9RHOB
MGAATVALAGCSGPFSTLEPRGPVAGSIAQLWWGMLGGALVLLALVLALFALVMLAPRRAARVSGRNWILWGGLGLPALVLPPLVIWALIAGERILPHPGQNVAVVEVEAWQFGWTFRYPQYGDVETQNILHLPVGQPVDLHLSSRDVIHGFWIPQLGGKLDAVPGHVNVLRLQADETGVFAGQCAEFCGVAHLEMRFETHVHAPEDLARALGFAADSQPEEAQP